MNRRVHGAVVGSPVSDDGRGLKHTVEQHQRAIDLGSPVSDDGRGLKPHARLSIVLIWLGSPVSDDGRGLKLSKKNRQRTCGPVRPSVMTGVD